ncbi:TPA: immunoglobulin-like domain-containing protein [Enterococcus faecium]
MKKKWVSSLLLGSLFLQVVTPMVSFAQETIETTTATSATIKKEDKPTKNSTDTSTSKDTEKQSATQPEASNSMDMNHPLNILPVPPGKPSDSEKESLNNQEATKPSVQAVAPETVKDLGPELFTNSTFADGPNGSVIDQTSIPGWTAFKGYFDYYKDIILGGEHHSMIRLNPTSGEESIYQDVSVTPGTTLQIATYVSTFKNSLYKIYAGPVSDDIEDFSVIGVQSQSTGQFTPRWAYNKITVPQGMTKMRIILAAFKNGQNASTYFNYFWEASLKQDLNPPVNTAPPVINASDRQVELNSAFDPLEGVTATDADDGTIPLNEANVVYNDVDTSKEGSYHVTYSVLDSGGLEGRKTITVTVGDANTPPVIHVPTTTVSIPQGGSFDPAPSKWNITATDAEDGDLTKNIVVQSNNVDTSKLGQYKVTYSVTDSGSLSATTDMNVVVSPEPTHKIELTVDQDTFFIEKGESVDITGEIWSNTQTSMQAVTIKKNGESSAFDGQVFMAPPVNQHNKYSLTIPVEKLNVGVNTFRLTGTDDQESITKDIMVMVSTNGQIGEKPVIHAEDKTIAQNSDFDPLADVSATDKEDGTVPVTVYENTVDTSKPGTYKVVYRATDSDNNTTEKTIAVTVEPSELSFNVPDMLSYDNQALTGNKEYAKRADKNWQITIDNSKK